MKKCIVISDSFKGTLSSLEICGIAQQSIPRFFPGCEVVTVPVADGGEGTVDCFVEAIHAEPVTVQVTGPYGEEIQATYCRSGHRAVVEMASAAGLPMVGDRRNAEKTTTYGVGQIIRHAVEQGCTEILLGLGGSCTNDGGCGCAAALGTKFCREDGTCFVPVGENLDQIAHIDVSETRKLLEQVQVTVMCDVDNPLYGPRGAAYVFAPQKGASPEAVAVLEAGAAHMSELFLRDAGVDIADLSGGAAAGGFAAGAVALLGAEIRSGSAEILSALGFADALADADAVITGEGRFDRQSACGKAIGGVIAEAKRAGVPVFVLAGSVGDVEDSGAAAVFSTVRDFCRFEDVRDDAKVHLRAAAESLAAAIALGAGSGGL